MENRTLADVGELEKFANAYLNWICKWMDPKGRYHLLLNELYQYEYVWVVPFDENRAEDGCVLRTRFEAESGLVCRESYIDWPCSVLEMLVALAARLEDSIFYETDKGDRTAQWFWEMIRLMGLDIPDDVWIRDRDVGAPYEDVVAETVNALCIGAELIFPTEGDLWGRAVEYFGERV